MSEAEPPRPLHPSLRELAEGLDEPHSAVIVTDSTGSILSWSDGAQRLYGWRREEVLGRQILGVTPTNLSMGEAAAIMSRLQAGIPWAGSFAVRNRGGEEIVADVLDIPVRDDDGRLIGIVGVSHAAEASR